MEDGNYGRPVTIKMQDRGGGIIMAGEKRCPIEETINLIGHKWKFFILWSLLQNDTMRFGELSRGIEGGEPEDADATSPADGSGRACPQESLSRGSATG